MKAKDIKTKDDQITYLWELLDHISTAGDVFKPEHTPYFDYVENQCKKRGEIANSFDGYTLTINELDNKEDI